MTGPGTVIAGRYRLVDQLAIGGMGSVWEAWDELLERPVAVKQLLTQPGLSQDESDTARLRVIREARITARLHHPHAVTLYDVVDQDGHPCLIMQYVPSKSLSTLLREKGPISVAFATRIGAELASALATAHRVGVVHRDVKPGNVLITEDGSAKLTDFGISHAVGDVTLTSTGVLTGTPAFLAPEVARGEESGFPADVFSLGATLYAALEGFPPFGTDPNPMAVLHRVASGRMLPPQQSGSLTPLLMRMLSTDPAARPAMTDVASTLNARLTGEPGRADSADRSTFALTVREDVDAHPSRRTPPPVVRTLAAAVPLLPPADPSPSGSGPAPAPSPSRHSRTPGPGSSAASSSVIPSSGNQSALDGSPSSQPSVSPPPGVQPPLRQAPPTPSRPAGSAVSEAAPIGRRPRGRRRTVLVATALVAVVALLSVVGYLATRSGDQGSAAGEAARISASSVPSSPASTSAARSTKPAAAAPAPAPAGSTSSSAAPPTPTSRQSAAAKPPASEELSTSAEPSTSKKSAPATTTEQDTTPSSAAGTGDHQGGAPTAAQLAAAITDYYAAMPTDTDRGWTRLTSNFQNGIARNRDYYESFWGSVDQVSAADVSASPPDTAEATITYSFKDGTVSTERTVFTLVEDGNALKIDDSSVVSGGSS